MTEKFVCSLSCIFSINNIVCIGMYPKIKCYILLISFNNLFCHYFQGGITVGVDATDFFDNYDEYGDEFRYVY